MRSLDTISEMIGFIIDKKLKYLVPREGQVTNVVDSAKKGRILVTIPSLGWNTNDTGAWCYSSDKNMLSTVKVGDWVIVQFVDGNADFPICIGKSTRIRDQVPKNFSGEATDHILFESPNNKIHVKYDESGNLLQVGNSDFRQSARVDDTTISSISEDSAFWTFFSAFFAVVTGVPIPEAGGGAPSAFQAALALAITGAGGTPTSQDGKITSGSSQVEVGDK